MDVRPMTPFETAIGARAQALTPPRSVAYKVFSRIGLPHRRIEGWRWSDFHGALRDASPSPAQLHAAPPRLADDLAGLKPIELRIVNGRIDIPLNAFPKGVQYGIVDAVATIPELETNSIAALNVAMSKKALGIEIGAGLNLAQPILIRHINTGAGFSFGQGLLRLCEGAHATLIETYEGDGPAFHSYLFHLVLKDGARLDRALFHETGPEAVVHSVFAPKVEGGAIFHQTALSTGARLSRHETHVHFVAPGARAEISTAALLAGDRHCDFTSEVVHLAPSCETRQRHKGVARERGRNVFQGKFRVLRAAQNTDARMNADALLLSDTAESNAKPELEIYADDVQCAHGSTVGALDPSAIFYMRQRGLSEAQARAMLVEAFVASTFDGVAHAGVAQAFRNRVAQWLESA